MGKGRDPYSSPALARFLDLSRSASTMASFRATWQTTEISHGVNSESQGLQSVICRGGNKGQQWGLTVVSYIVWHFKTLVGLLKFSTGIRTQAVQTNVTSKASAIYTCRKCRSTLPTGCYIVQGISVLLVAWVSAHHRAVQCGLHGGQFTSDLATIKP